MVRRGVRAGRGRPAAPRGCSPRAGRRASRLRVPNSTSSGSSSTPSTRPRGPVRWASSAVVQPEPRADVEHPLALVHVEQPQHRLDGRAAASWSARARSAAARRTTRAAVARRQELLPGHAANASADAVHPSSQARDSRVVPDETAAKSTEPQPRTSGTIPSSRGRRGTKRGTRAAYSSQPGRCVIVRSRSLAPVTLRRKWVIASGATGPSPAPASQPEAAPPASQMPHHRQASPK